MSVQTTQVGGPSADAQSPTGGPGAGEERVTSSADSTANRGQPDQTGEPKGNPRPEQSSDNLSQPKWVQQLSKKLTADPDSAARLSAYKTLDDFVQASIEIAAKSEGLLAIPGKDSDLTAVQAFYERLGKPKEAEGYSFAKNEPALAAAAFNANLSASQADAIYRASQAQLDDARKGIQASLVQDYQATDVLLQKEYGEKYGEALDLMQRGMGNNPSTEELSPIAGALVKAGLAGKPEIVRAFIELGRATSEGSSPRGNMGSSRPESITQGRGFSYKDQY